MKLDRDAFNAVQEAFLDALTDIGDFRLVARCVGTRLQEITQKIFKEVPVYSVVETRGPDHQRLFISQVSIAGKLYGRGEGPSETPPLLQDRSGYGDGTLRQTDHDGQP